MKVLAFFGRDVRIDCKKLEDIYGKSWLMQSLERRLCDMQFSISPQPVVALIAGILILLVPRLLNYIVAIYLIVFGILGLLR